MNGVRFWIYIKRSTEPGSNWFKVYLNSTTYHDAMSEASSVYGDRCVGAVQYE
jgi:hypothetical protein